LLINILEAGSAAQWFLGSNLSIKKKKKSQKTWMMLKDGSKGQDVEKLAAYLHIKSLLSLKEVDCVIIMGFFFHSSLF
jgi:hypothetical protein